MAFLEARPCRSPCVSRGIARQSSLPCLRLSARVPEVTVRISMGNGIGIQPVKQLAILLIKKVKSDLRHKRTLVQACGGCRQHNLEIGPPC
jgi:hypothetical protein